MDMTQFVMATIGLLGRRGRDKVTKFEGVVTNVSFDLYGCVQTGVSPGLNKDGELQDARWFDVNRITILEDEPVMPVPDFSGYDEPADYRKGPADKPNPAP